MKPQKLTNEEYHADRTHISSSGVKYLYNDPTKYYKYYVLNEKTKESRAMLLGTVLHTFFLEPGEFDKEYYITGMRANNKKVIEASKVLGLKKLSRSLYDQAVEIYKNADHLKIKSILKEGNAEESFFGEILGVPVKVRTDYKTNDHIYDLKTTSRDMSSLEELIEQSDYDLSAAFYMDILGLNKFTWIFVSTRNSETKCLTIDSNHDIYKRGKSKYTKGLDVYKENKHNNFKDLEKFKLNKDFWNGN